MFLYDLEELCLLNDSFLDLSIEEPLLELIAPGVEADADEDFALALISASEIVPDARSLELRTEVAPGAIDREEDPRFFS